MNASSANYNTMKNKKNTPDRLEMNKYCPFCRKHTVHSETKVMMAHIPCKKRRVELNV